MGIVCVMNIGVLMASLSAFVTFYTNMTWYPAENNIIVVTAEIVIFQYNVQDYAVISFCG